jgi:hypothetical protein
MYIFDLQFLHKIEQKARTDMNKSMSAEINLVVSVNSLPSTLFPISYKHKSSVDNHTHYPDHEHRSQLSHFLFEPQQYQNQRL